MAYILCELTPIVVDVLERESVKKRELLSAYNTLYQAVGEMLNQPKPVLGLYELSIREAYNDVTRKEQVLSHEVN